MVISVIFALWLFPSGCDIMFIIDAGKLDLDLFWHRDKERSHVLNKDKSFSPAVPSLPFILPNTQDIIKPWTYQEKGQSNASLENVDTVDTFMNFNHFCPLHVRENTEFGMANNQVQFSTEQSDILSLLGTDKLCVTKNSSQLVKLKGESIRWWWSLERGGPESGCFA